MAADEPRVRRRGFFLHSSDTGEGDAGDHETAEGFSVRARNNRSATRPRINSSARQSSGRQSRDDQQPAVAEGLPAIRSGSVTGTRRRAH